MATTHRPNAGDDRLSPSKTDAALRSTGPLADDVPTTQLENPAAQPDGPGLPPDQTQRLGTVAADQPLIDRAGDALARQPRQMWLRYTRLEEHQRGVVAALAALGLFLLLVALLGR